MEENGNRKAEDGENKSHCLNPPPSSQGYSFGNPSELSDCNKKNLIIIQEIISKKNYLKYCDWIAWKL